MTLAAKRVCNLTGGGDAPGLNAVTRGVVKRAHQLGIDIWERGRLEGLDPRPGRAAT